MSHELLGNIAAAAGTYVWHGMVNTMRPNMTIEEWLEGGRCAFTVDKIPAVAAFGDGFKNTNQYFLARRDTKHVFGHTVTDTYQVAQPIDLGNTFRDHILADDRFAMETVFALRHGDTIVMTARYRDDLTVAGERVQNRILMSTTFDCSGATLGKPVTTCVVCNNTLQAALAEPQSAIRIRHNTKYSPEQMAKGLAKIAQGYAKFKVMGDAMAQAQMAHTDVAAFFKQLLDIPADAKKEDISTRKLNQYSDLSTAYGHTARERGLDARADTPTAWLALNAVTRYVDHAKSVRNADEYFGGENEARFASAQFGTGAQLKAKAWELLMPRVRDLVAA